MPPSPILDRTDRSITFRVDDVQPAAEPLAEVQTAQALERLAGARPVAASDWTGRLVDRVEVHPLIAAVHLAFSQHRPLLDVYKVYFDYVLACVCGIPAVTLEGTARDWAQLARRAAGLSQLGLSWWTKRLVPVCLELAAAAGGRVDRAHWQGIYKRRDAYG